MNDPDVSRRVLDLRDTVVLTSQDLERLAERIAHARPRLGPNADPLEVYGAAALIHGYYTYLERLFERVARDLNHRPVEGPDWHRRLLRSMTLDRPGARPPLVDVTTSEELDELLRFRHLFRNLYILNLEPERVATVADRVAKVHTAIRSNLETFGDFLRVLAGSD